MAIGGLAYVASALTQAIVFRMPATGFFAVVVLPVLIGAVIVCLGAWGMRFVRPEAVQATWAAVAIAVLVAVVAFATGGRAFLPFHAVYIAVSWAWASVPTALAAALLPPRPPASVAAPGAT